MAWRNSPINEFLDSVKSMGKEEMLLKAIGEKELIALEIRNYQGNRDYPEFKSKMRYYGNLKCLVYFLENQDRPENIYPPVFRRFEWIARKLIKKGDFDEEVLKLFD